MSKHSFLTVYLLVFASAMACGRINLDGGCPSCGRTGPDARGLGTEDGSAGREAAEAARDIIAADALAANCGTLTASRERTPADILIVLDRSESMKLPATEDPACSTASGCSSRWQVMTDTLKMGLESGAYFRWGLKLYPSQGAGTCGVDESVEVPLALDSAAGIESALAGVVLYGSAPVGDTLRSAGKYLQTVTDNSIKGILLATSGAAACGPAVVTTDAGSPIGNYSELDSIQAARELQDLHIPVYVMSFDAPSTNQPFLSALASAGGTAAYYPATDPNGFVADRFPPEPGFPTCSIVLPTPPPDPGNLAVTVNGDAVPHDPTQVDGWDLVRPDLITLFGSYCDRLLPLDKVTINIVFGCP